MERRNAADKTGPLAGIPYHGADPKWLDLYHPKAAPDDKGWYSNNSQWHEEWLKRISDVVDRYQLDLLYSDGGIPFGEAGRKLVAHFYNANIQQHGGKLEAVYNSKRQGRENTSRGPTFWTSNAGACGEALDETRPWKVYWEGPTVTAGGAFKENFPFTADDVRFTSKGPRFTRPRWACRRRN